MQEDVSSISDIRKYEYGDSFKKIHWKLSAKVNDLMVRNFETTSRTKYVVFLDLRKQGLPGELEAAFEDKFIEAAAAVVNYLLSNRISMDLVYHQRELIRLEGDNPGDFDGIYGVLAGVPFEAQVDLKGLEGLYRNDITLNTKYIIITSSPEDALFSEMPETRLYGHELQVINISSGEDGEPGEGSPENSLSALEGIGIKTYSINLNGNIKEILER